MHRKTKQKEIPELFNKKEECCGCAACYNICPTSAISIEEDKAGFKYPSIDSEKCIKCQRCKEVCGFQNSEVKNTPIETYVAVSKDEDILKKSSSGGVFTSIAKAFIEEGGLVSGAAFDDNWQLKHIIIDNLADLHRLQGSKYLQSSIEQVFTQIKSALNKGVKVLFSGTPCQVHGLLSYLGSSHENLFTIDLVCHGVPSNKMFKDYLFSLEEKAQSKVVNYVFRDKTIGWGKNARVLFANGHKKKIWESSSPYMYFFAKSSILRESCFRCKYTCKNRPADLSIGDYWGIEKYHYELLKDKINSSKGVSLIITNTIKGQALIKSLDYCFDLYLSSFEYASKNNTQLRKPSTIDMKAHHLTLYSKKGWPALEEIYKNEVGLKKFKNQLMSLIPRQLRDLMKRYR